MSTFNPCIVVPNCNHLQDFAARVATMLACGVPVIVVNDGSNAATTAVLDNLDRDLPDVEVMHFAVNQGKGAAVIAGMHRARHRGFTHVLQIDADGQHDLADLGKFLALSRDYPAAVICGCPIYDDSVPSHRKLCRYLTHNLVWLQTLSFSLRDSMCGFRVYPLAAVSRVLARYSIGKRMDFDIDILVKLYWEKVAILSVRTRVIYPENGLSNYRLWADNLLLIHMHVRLVAGMLLRIPGLLLYRNVPCREPDVAGLASHWPADAGKHHSPGTTRRPEPAKTDTPGRLPEVPAADSPKTPEHWAGIAERGSVSGLRLLLWIYQHLGRWVFLLLLHPVVLYFTLFAGQARSASRQYWVQLAACRNLKPDAGLRTLYAHFYAFGVAAIDKIASWNGDIRRSDAVVHGEQHFDHIVAAKQGAVFIGSHLGNLELCRALGEKSRRFRINAVVFNKNALKFQQVLRACAPDVELNLIHVEAIGMDTAILLKQKVDAGEIVIIVGDRISVKHADRVIHANFLGRMAPFAEGPFILASVLDCPVYLIFCIREAGTYHIHLEPFAATLKFPRAGRRRMLAGKVQEYAGRLEYHALKAPFQWFNFFDFWQDNPGTTAHELPVESEQS